LVSRLTRQYPQGRPQTTSPTSSPPTAEELSFNTQADLDSYIAKLETEMRESAKRFEFERAATLRDQIKDLRTKEFLFS
jgi:excinuclease UvrABC helicase subunit UvrB